MTIAERNRAYEKAILFVVEKGMGDVPVKHLIDWLGVSHCTFYNEFYSRTDLFDSCFAYVDEGFSNFLDSIETWENETMRAFFYRVIGSLYDYLMEHKSHTLFYSIYGDFMQKRSQEKKITFMQSAYRAADRARERYQIGTSVQGRLLWIHVFSETFALVKYVIAGFVPETKETRGDIITIVLDGLFGGISGISE